MAKVATAARVRGVPLASIGAACGSVAAPVT
jgi:hypothetical protein